MIIMHNFCLWLSRNLSLSMGSLAAFLRARESM
jgi:hypothetical protein